LTTPRYWAPPKPRMHTKIGDSKIKPIVNPVPLPKLLLSASISTIDK
jgi:hypothetical protein